MGDRVLETAGPPLLKLTAAARKAIVRKWLTQTVRGYPEHTSRFLLRKTDPFANPVGRALREGLPVLLDELAGAFDKDKLAEALDDIVRIRAVQDFTASEAVSFLFLLKPIIRASFDEQPPELAAVDKRIDELVLLAFDLYMKCREATYDIRLREAKRRVYVVERAASSRTRS